MTMGDFWGFEKAGIKLKYIDGLSCLLVNNENVLPMVSELNLDLQEVPIKTIIDGNGQLQHPYYKDAKWDNTMESFANEGYEKLEDDFRNKNSRLLKRIKIMKLLPPKVLSLLKKVKNG